MRTAKSGGGIRRLFSACSGAGRNCWRAIITNPAGLALLVLIPALTGAWAGAVHLRKAERFKMAHEAGSVGEFWGPPKPNRANTRMFFAQRTENGVGVFLCATDGSGREMVFEEPQNSLAPRLLDLFSWSPNDKLFAYIRQAKHTENQDIILCDGETGKTVLKLRTPKRRCAITEFAWLSSSAFAYVDCERTLRVVARAGDDQWSQARVIKNMSQGKKVRGLVAPSSNTLTWNSGGTMWKLYLDQDRPPEKVWESTTHSLVGHFFSAKTGRFLLNCGRSGQVSGEETGDDGSEEEDDSGSESGSGWLMSFARYQEPAAHGRLGNPTQAVFKVSWVNDEKGYAYFSARKVPRNMAPWTPYRKRTLFVKPTESAEPVQLLGAEEVIDYTPSGDRLYILGSQTNEPSGIWEYDLETERLRCVVPGAPPFQHTKGVGAQYKVSAIKKPSGYSVSYYLWEPPNVSPNRKYPVVIAHGPYRWQSEAVVAANCGFYFASANRSGWAEGMDNWVEEVMCTYGDLARHPNVDTNRVFLFATSAETVPLCQLLALRPELWEGAVLQGPSALPDVSRIQVSKMLLTAGRAEKGAVERLTEYQRKAAQYGIPVTVAFHEGGHLWTATSTSREHAVRLAEFLMKP